MDRERYAVCDTVRMYNTVAAFMGVLIQTTPRDSFYVWDEGNGAALRQRKEFCYI